MPIVFQPQSPAGSMPGIAYQGGEGEAIMKMAPLLNDAIRMRMQALAQAGENATRANIAGMGIAQRAQESQDEMAMRGSIAQANIQAEMMQQAAQQQHQMAMQEQGIQNQMRMMALEPTHAARMELERRRAVNTETDQAIRDGILTPVQGGEVKAKNWGYMSDMMRQEAEWQQTQRQAQAEAAQQKAALLSGLMGQQQAAQLGFWHKTANALAGHPDAPAGAIQAIPVIDKDGQVIGHQVLSPEGKTTWAQKEQMIRGLQPKDFSSLVKDSIDMATKMLTKEEPTGESDAQGNAKTKKVLPNPKDIQPLAKELLDGMLSMVDEQVDKRKPGYKPPEQASPQDVARHFLGRMGYDVGQKQGRPSSDAPVPGMGADPINKPFDLKDTAGVTPKTARMLQSFREGEKTLSDPRFSAQERQAGSVYLGTMRDLLAAWGDYRSMPPDAKRVFDDATKNADAIFEALKKRPREMAKPAFESMAEGFPLG